MKKLVFLLVFALLQMSCSLETSSDQAAFLTVSVPMDSVELPSEFEFGRTYTINVAYRVPTTCYSFADMFIIDEGNTKTIAVINRVITDQLCEAYTDRIDVASFDLKIENRGTYTLRFWKGKDDTGRDNYYIVEVPVTGG